MPLLRSVIKQKNFICILLLCASHNDHHKPATPPLLPPTTTTSLAWLKIHQTQKQFQHVQYKTNTEIHSITITYRLWRIEINHVMYNLKEIFFLCACVRM